MSQCHLTRAKRFKRVKLARCRCGRIRDSTTIMVHYHNAPYLCRVGIRYDINIINKNNGIGFIFSNVVQYIPVITSVFTVSKLTFRLFNRAFPNLRLQLEIIVCKVCLRTWGPPSLPTNFNGRRRADGHLRVLGGRVGRVGGLLNPTR